MKKLMIQIAVFTLVYIPLVMLSEDRFKHGALSCLLAWAVAETSVSKYVSEFIIYYRFWRKGNGFFSSVWMGIKCAVEE